ncbi:polysaccharide polymerase [Rhodoferax sp. U2-2l]|uniref:polysaccharide polymerase n=1 Tax=Rhodoferax sp. U2-2l TaxID=2884000 RepID=UPI001D0ACB2F|nr:polysaccharide polymerase [Rhodoferax sp. U2-2l]MCB8746901.1 polysaccharide polymerase [Rhodoferax sp. U2-2l]
MPHLPLYAPPQGLNPTCSARLVLFILVASVGYLPVISFLNARGISASPALVGLFEVAIYALCLYVLGKRLPMATVAFTLCAFAWIVFTWLMRQSADAKTLRDLIIPILFLTLGRHLADAGVAEKGLKLIVIMVVSVGLFEAVFTDTYAELFNTFAFYRQVTGVSEDAAMFKGQMLSLNGYRPEGIGRTILPFLLGSHRTSSLFLEPVGLGNFAVIVLAWALSKPWPEIRRAHIFTFGAVLLITLSDSRFGLLMSAMLVFFRWLPLSLSSKVAPALPVLSLGLVLAVTVFLPSPDDNFVGRVTSSGLAVLEFDWRMLLGLGSPLPNFGDMGFAYLLSRFGAPLSIALVLTLFLIPMPNDRARRFRILIVLYVFANLAISGTSVFALKSAGILWFLVGVLSTLPAERANPSADLAPQKVGLEPLRAPFQPQAMMDIPA